MRHLRRALILLVVAGCGKHGGNAGAGSGSAPVVVAVVADAAAPAVDAMVTIDKPPPAPGCFPADFNAKLDSLTASDVAATICGTNEAKVSKCVAISLATGKATEAARPPAVPAAPTPGGYKIQDDATQAALCKGAVCTKLALAPLPDGTTPASTPRIVISPNGTVAVAPLEDKDLEVRDEKADGGISKRVTGLGLFDTASGRRMKILEVTDESYKCPEPGRFLGADVIYAVFNVCSGPGGRASLYKLDGSPIGTLAADFNIEGGDPVHLDGDTWAVPTFGGGGALVFDAKKGLALRGITKVGDDAFHLCPDCHPFGDPGEWISPLARTPGGKLVVVSQNGGMSVLDPTSGKVENAWAFPICAK